MNVFSNKNYLNNVYTKDTSSLIVLEEHHVPDLLFSSEKVFQYTCSFTHSTGGISRDIEEAPVHSKVSGGLSSISGFCVRLEFFHVLPTFTHQTLWISQKHGHAGQEVRSLGSCNL